MMLNLKRLKIFLDYKELEMIPTNKLLRSEHKRIKKYQEKDKKVIPLKKVKSTYDPIFGQRLTFE